MLIPDIRFWAGTEESFNSYLAGLKAAATLDVQAYYNDQTDQGEPEPARLLSVQGDVGVISITGSLVPGAPWYAKYTGMTGYGEIRQALVEAANNSEIGGILLDVNSGGGAVAGVTDVADLIKMVDTQIKPVSTFSDGLIASAALWVGASARSLQIGKVAEAGSIGVLTVLKSMQEYYKQMGISAEVLRSAEFKALGHPLDPITDKARAEIMAQLMHMDTMFNAHMAEARGVTEEMAREKFGKGRVFIGQQAVDTGLVDAVSTFDGVISAIQGAIDSQKQRSQYGANFSNSKGPAVKTALTTQQLAAIAEGAPAGEQALQGPAATTAPTTVPATEPAAAAPEPAAAAPEPKADEGKPTELVAFLQSQLSTAQAQTVNLGAQVLSLTKSAEEASQTMATMRSIVEASVERLNVALNLPTGSASAMDNNNLLAAHAALRGQFEMKFKAGGVAAVSAGAPAEKVDAEVDTLRMRRIKANRLSD